MILYKLQIEKYAFLKNDNKTEQKLKVYEAAYIIKTSSLIKTLNNHLHTRYRIVLDVNVDQRFFDAPPFFLTIQILVIFEQCFPVDFWKIFETHTIIWVSFKNFWIQNGRYIHFQIIYQTICWNCLKTQPLPVFRVESSYKLVDSLFPNRWNTSQSFIFFGL